MSHIIAVEMRVKDLDALDKACAAIGCELVRDQKTYKWYGYSVGDYPLPKGFTKEDLGKCDHAIRVKGATANTYEVGIAKAKDGDGYELLLDFWAGGHGLIAKIGEAAVNLKNHYTAQVSAKAMRKQGYRVVVKETSKGLKLLCSK